MKIKAGHIVSATSVLLTIGCTIAALTSLYKSGISNETLAWIVGAMGWGVTLVYQCTAAILLVYSQKYKNDLKRAVEIVSLLEHDVCRFEELRKELEVIKTSIK